MKKLSLVLSAFALVGGVATMAAAAHITEIPEGQIPAVPGDEGTVPCDILLRYDDGTDDTPGFGYTLGYYSGSLHQFLGVVFTTPGGGDHEVQSASFFSEFWVLPGMVDIEATEVANPSNTTTASVNVTGGGTWEVAFDTPICIPAGGDYAIMVCPRPGVFGVSGEDTSGPSGRSYFSDGACDPVNPFTAEDLMIWSCVTPCGGTPVLESTWGAVKNVYR
jgi:hypothetical protein